MMFQLLFMNKMTASSSSSPSSAGGGSSRIISNSAGMFGDGSDAGSSNNGTPSRTTTAGTTTPTTATTATTAAACFDLDRWQRGGMTAFEQTCFHEYWDDLPPLVDKKMDVDPHDFLHRMALGKYLIEHTGGPNVWGVDCWKHWFWAYLAQMDWQWRSGRFEPPVGVVAADATTAVAAAAGKEEGEMDGSSGNHRHPRRPMTIATDSWWGYMNMGFIVGAYCGAAKAGVVPPISIVSKSDVAHDDDVHFQSIVDNWCDFFTGPHAEFVAGRSSSSSQNVDVDDSTTRRPDSDDPYAVFSLYDQLWTYHSDTVRNGRLGAKSLEAILPPEDLKLGMGWCKMVALFDAMGWPHLSLEALLEDGAGYLPTLRLDSGGSGNNLPGSSASSSSALAYLKEHRPREYLACQTLFTLDDTPESNVRYMAKFWKRVSHYRTIRANLPKILDKVTYGSVWTKTAVMSRLAGIAVLPQTGLESATWVAFLIGAVMMGAIKKGSITPPRRGSK
jgi:LPXTG-motif cell wall-anchored protein